MTTVNYNFDKDVNNKSETESTKIMDEKNITKATTISMSNKYLKTPQ